MRTETIISRALLCLAMNMPVGVTARANVNGDEAPRHAVQADADGADVPRFTALTLTGNDEDAPFRPAGRGRFQHLAHVGEVCPVPQEVEVNLTDGVHSRLSFGSVFYGRRSPVVRAGCNKCIHFSPHARPLRRKLLVLSRFFNAFLSVLPSPGSKSS